MCDIGARGCFCPGRCGQALGGMEACAPAPTPLSWVVRTCSSGYLGQSPALLQRSVTPLYKSTPRSLWGPMCESLRATALLCCVFRDGFCFWAGGPCFLSFALCLAGPVLLVLSLVAIVEGLAGHWSWFPMVAVWSGKWVTAQFLNVT